LPLNALAADVSVESQRATLNTVLTIADKGALVDAVIRLLPHLPESLKQEAATAFLENARDIGEAIGPYIGQAQVLSELVATLPVELRREALEMWLETAPLTLSRARALDTLLPFIQTLKKDINSEDIVKMSKIIIEVSEWWP
jgi:hypothetical protein